jgi:hypothetical protein
LTKWLLNHSNIKRVRDNPITLKWFDDKNNSPSDEHDEHDKENEPNQETNDNKIQKKYGSRLEHTSDTSGSSDSSFNNDAEQKEELEEVLEEPSVKGFQFSKNGRIYRTTNEQYQELTGKGGDFN